jgi:hypothetical protein
MMSRNGMSEARLMLWGVDNKQGFGTMFGLGSAH